MNEGARFYGALFLADQVLGVVLCLGVLFLPGTFHAPTNGLGLWLHTPLLLFASVTFGIWALRCRWPGRLLLLPGWHMAGLVAFAGVTGDDAVRLGLQHSLAGLWVGGCVLASLERAARAGDRPRARP
jgi:hypothetical protein